MAEAGSGGDSAQGRRLSAILNADIVGYSRLMAEDPDATVGRVTAYREEIGPVIRAHRGRLVDFAGDNFLAEFPTATEAMSCAVALQRALRAADAETPERRRMLLRMGIHLGEVQTRGERIYGDGVNIAGRLQALADPAGICISGPVFEQVRTRFDDLGYVDLGGQSLHNIPYAVHAFQVQLDGAPIRSYFARARFALAALLGVLGLAGVFAWFGPRMPDVDIFGSSRTAGSSIAVLPFANLGGTPGTEIFGDGLAEEILNLLARLPELKVAARTSSFYFRNRDGDIRTIAEQLGVTNVLEGSVRRDGDRVRVTAQLIDGETGFHRWSATYDRELVALFEIQDDISRQVVRALKVVLSSESHARLRARSTENFDAYQYYLQGRSFLRRPRELPTLENAALLFERALAEDPTYAQAHAGLCDTYLARYRLSRATKLFDAAERACQQALALDQSSSDVNAALGNLYRHSGRYDEALERIETAIALNPNSVEARGALAETYARQGRSDDAERAFREAIDLQPGYWAGYQLLGNFFFSERRFADALGPYRRVTGLSPDNASGYSNLGAAHYMLGDFESAAVAWQSSLDISPSVTAYSNVGTMYFYLGRFDDAIGMYSKALELAPEDHRMWGNLADADRFLPDHEESARAAYQRAIELGEATLAINPADAETMSDLAHYYATSGQAELALELIERAIERAPTDMYVWYRAALVNVAFHKPEAALDALEHAVELGYLTQLLPADRGLSSLWVEDRFKTLVQNGEGANTDTQ